MQTKKSSDYHELKKSICKNYLKGVCPFGKECKYRHPAKQRNTMAETEVPVCRYFLQNTCRRGDQCPYIHITPKPEKLKQRSDWLTFCLYFPSGRCKNKECRFLHITDDDKALFRATGKIGSHVLEQAMCKALLQDVALNGATPTCKEYLQGHCKWMSCPMQHLTRQEFSQTVLDALHEKFDIVIGPKETYQSLSANAYDPSVEYQEHMGYDSLPAFKNHAGPDRYIPAREKYVTDDPYRNDYGNKHSWHDGRVEHDQQKFVSTETDRIIKGIYNLMKDDANLIRNAEKQEISDLRGKLDSLAEENARYRYEFSRLRPFEGETYRAPPVHPVPDKNNFKYQDVIRRLEKENYDMKRQLVVCHEQEQVPHYMGKPESLYLGRQNMEQEQRRGGGGGMRGQSHLKHGMRGGEDRRWYDCNAHGAYIHVEGHMPPYNPLKQKVSHQLQQNMAQQYKRPLQMNQGASQYTKVNYQKSQKHNQQINRKSQQQFPKTQKVNQNQKKKQETPNFNQAKSVKPKKVTKSESDKEDNVPKVENEDDSSVVETHSEKEDNESSQEIEARISGAGTLDAEDNSNKKEQEVTCTNGSQGQNEKEEKNASSQEMGSSVVEVHSEKEEKNESSLEMESSGVEMHSEKEDKNERSQEMESSVVETHSVKEDKNECSQEMESIVVETHSEKEDKNECSQGMESSVVERHSKKEDKNECSQEMESSVVERHSEKDDKNESSQENEARINKAGTLEAEDNSNKKEQELTSTNGNQGQDENKDEINGESENTSKDADVRQEKTKTETENEERHGEEKERKQTSEQDEPDVMPKKEKNVVEENKLGENDCDHVADVVGESVQ